jgi:hypothetical protein
MNMVPVQNVIPGPIEPVPVLASILTCLAWISTEADSPNI